MRMSGRIKRLPQQGRGFGLQAVRPLPGAILLVQHLAHARQDAAPHLETVRAGGAVPQAEQGVQRPAAGKIADQFGATGRDHEILIVQAGVKMAFQPGLRRRVRHQFRPFLQHVGQAV